MPQCLESLTPHSLEKFNKTQAQLIESLPSVHEALDCTDPQHHSGWLWWSARYPITQEIETGGAEVVGYPWLCAEFEASLGRMRPCLKKTKKWMAVTRSPQTQHHQQKSWESSAGKLLGKHP